MIDYLKLSGLMLLFAVGLAVSDAFSSSPSGGSKLGNESVDLIELNHFHDCTGKHVYDQVIFYEWSIEALAYRVRAWALVEDKDATNRRPIRCYETDMYRVRWHDRDQNIMRCISSRHFRESWTQIDPERANKKIFDERQRVCLTKRTFDPALCQDTIEGCE
jgi:hypothetical protein